MCQLSELVAERIGPYLQGLTMNYDMSQDILQETLLELVQSIDKIKKPESFWCWIYQMAQGKAMHHYRDRDKQQSIIMRVAKGVLRHCQDENLSGLNYVMRMELSDIIFKAMGSLKFEQRNVMLLRCFEKLSFAEIADAMNCKELYARVLFHRARKSLQKNMRQDGFSKEYLLAALIIFRLLIKPAEANAGTVLMTASVFQADTCAFIISALASKVGLTIASLATLFTVFATTRSVLYAVGVIAFALYALFWLWLADLYHH